MPNTRTQRYLFWIATIGVATSCFGCGLASQNQMRAAQIFLFAAWLILVPLFGFLLSTRRRMKRVVRKRDVQRSAELDALANIDLPGTTGDTRPAPDGAEGGAS